MGPISSLFALLVIGLVIIEDCVCYISFDEGYSVTWAPDHVWDQGDQVQLSMDQHSGSGFESKQTYGSGFFHMKIKLPDRNSAGVVTAFYLSSNGNNHDELDFEFLGNREGKPITLQTNVYVNGHGDREQRTLLWFDPTADFHNYQILWNEHQIVFFVENIPIRVHKKKSAPWVYPTRPMHIEASLWDGDSWATDGGLTKIDWNYAPFRAHFQEFDIRGCVTDSNREYVDPKCHKNKYWWNSRKYWELTADQQKQYHHARAKYMNYDYCSDRPRYPVPPPECFLNGQ